MKWLSNTYDPKRPDSNMYVARLFDQTQEEAVANHREWLKGKIIAQPQATDAYTVEQLEAMHMVGVYAPETADERMMAVWGPFLYEQEQHVAEMEKRRKEDHPA